LGFLIVQDPLDLDGVIERFGDSVLLIVINRLVAVTRIFAEFLPVGLRRDHVFLGDETRNWNKPLCVARLLPKTMQNYPRERAELTRKYALSFNAK
jgi:hypothetical protein